MFIAHMHEKPLLGFANSDYGRLSIVSRLYLYLQVRSRLRTHFVATLAISFPRKLLRQRLENSPRPLHAPASVMPLALLVFLNPRSQEPPGFSLSHPHGEHRRRSPSTNAPMHRVDRERVEDERGISDSEEVRALESPPRGDSRPLRNERELIHCARIPAVISGRRVGRRRGAARLSSARLGSTRRRYRSSFAPPFHARFILRLSRRISQKILIRLIRDCLDPVTEHKWGPSIH